jgi:hypothetical protein
MKRGQMFVVTTIFLVSLIFVVQQLLFQYASVDPKEGFQYNEYGIVKSIRDAANATLANSGYCDALAANMEILNSFINSRSASTGYAIEFSYALDCSAFGNSPPSPAPLNVTVRFLGSNIDSTSRFSFYK